jgi:hypothetical protein
VKITRDDGFKLWAVTDTIQDINTILGKRIVTEEDLLVVLQQLASVADILRQLVQNAEFQRDEENPWHKL